MNRKFEALHNYTMPCQPPMLSRCSPVQACNNSMPSKALQNDYAMDQNITHEDKSKIHNTQMLLQKCKNMSEMSAVAVGGPQTFELQMQCHRSSLPILLADRLCTLEATRLGIPARPLPRSRRRFPRLSTSGGSGSVRTG